MESSVTTVVARNDFSTVLNRAAFGKERVILKRRGKAIAAVVPMDDLLLLQAMEDRRDIADGMGTAHQPDIPSPIRPSHRLPRPAQSIAGP